MKVGSICTGIGCFDLGLERAGHEISWQIENDPYARRVLKRHWPEVRRYEDLRVVDATALPAVDLIVGGTPCQDLSVAGGRAGLDGERSRLFYDFVDLADSQPSAWILWENVVGVLSDSRGRSFATVLERITGCAVDPPESGWQTGGFCVGPRRWAAWRVLDARYFGVPQRRRRVFVVAGPRGEPRPEVLLEPTCVPRSTRPSAAPGSHAPACSASGARGVRRVGDDPMTVSPSLTQNERGGGGHSGWTLAVTPSLLAANRGTALDQSYVVDETQVTHPENRSNHKPGDPSSTLTARSRCFVVRPHFGQGSDLEIEDADVSPALTATERAKKTERGVVTLTDVGAPRRLTPLEWERLMGLPDGWTDVGLSDRRRYALIGNGGAVPVLEWIGRRIRCER